MIHLKLLSKEFLYSKGVKSHDTTILLFWKHYWESWDLVGQLHLDLLGLDLFHLLLPSWEARTEFQSKPELPE